MDKVNKTTTYTLKHNSYINISKATIIYNQIILFDDFISIY